VGALVEWGWLKWALGVSGGIPGGGWRGSSVGRCGGHQGCGWHVRGVGLRLVVVQGVGVGVGGGVIVGRVMVLAEGQVFVRIEFDEMMGPEGVARA